MAGKVKEQAHMKEVTAKSEQSHEQCPGSERKERLLEQQVEPHLWGDNCFIKERLCGSHGGHFGRPMKDIFSWGATGYQLRPGYGKKQCWSEPVTSAALRGPGQGTQDSCAALSMAIGWVCLPRKQPNNKDDNLIGWNVFKMCLSKKRPYQIFISFSS